LIGETRISTPSRGGPIIKNKTFFFALWDQNISRTRAIVTTPVLTDAARQGIFRYFDFYNSADAHFVPPASRRPRRRRTRWSIFWVIHGRLRQIRMGLPVYRKPAVFQRVRKCEARRQSIHAVGLPGRRCDDAGSAWDRLRPAADQTGYIKKLLAAMPRANYFYQGGTAIGERHSTA
jgi:hypothetical protein